MIVWYDIVGRLVVATLAGSLIGYERRKKGKPAGMRTHMLVALAAASFVLSVEQAAAICNQPVEAARIISAIATGMGFLGAGVIVKSGENVRGLTTATSLWATAALGSGLGMGLWWVALPTTLLVWVILHLVDPLENRWFGEGRE